MSDSKQPAGPNYLLSLYRSKCPRCRTGDMFQSKAVYNLRGFMKMHEQCPVCGQAMEIEPGFYYGTSYISYAVTVVLSAMTFVAWWLTIGFSLKDNRLFYWIGVNAVFLLLLQPWLMRVSRSLWLSFFARYDPGWKEHDEAERAEVERAEAQRKGEVSRA